MTVKYDATGKPIQLQTPSNASRIFGLDQESYYGNLAGGNTIGVPRPKFLFVVRFVRGAGEGSARWRDGISLAVKSMDRPRINPQTKEMNQYNKKRIVYTGINYSPVNVDFHDTVDSIVYSMWHEYAGYYYGDFNRDTDFDWKYDVTMSDFNDTGGFGVVLPPTGNSPLESSFFFERVECYQFSGGLYTQFDLVHPKISSFDPDSMEYDNPGSNSIRLSLDYETVIYHNQMSPRPIYTNSKIMELYGDQIDGHVYEPNGKYEKPFFGDLKNRASSIDNLVQSVGRLIGNEELAGAQIIPEKVHKGLGVLSSFGVFDFGSGIEQVASPITGALENILGVDFSEMGSNRTGVFTATPSYTRGIPADKLDVAAAQAQAQMKPGTQANTGRVAGQLISDLTGQPVNYVINKTRSPTSQVGVREVRPMEKPPL